MQGEGDYHAMAVLGVDTDKGSLICKNSWGVKIPTVEMYKKKPFYSKNQALWDGGISFSVRLHTMANGEGYVDFECSEASDTESDSESGEVVGQEPLADEMPEGVAYDGKLLENVGDVLVQTKDLREHHGLVGHVRGDEVHEVLYHCDAQQAHVGSAEDVEVEGVASGLERVHKRHQLDAHAYQGLLGAIGVEAYAAGEHDVDDVGQDAGVLRNEGRKVHAVVFYVGHAVVDELAHQVHRRVVVVDDEATDVAADVGKVLDGEDMLCHGDEERRGLCEQKRIARADHVDGEQVAVDLALHRLAVIHLLEEHVHVVGIGVVLETHLGRGHVAPHHQVLFKSHAVEDSRHVFVAEPI